MMELAQANWPLIVAGLVIGLLVAWWVFVATRRTTVETDRTDALDEGKAPASRNQALIDAPPTAEPPPVAAPPAVGVGGAGTAVAAATAEAMDKPAKAAPETNDSATDDLRRIKGVGPKLVTVLQNMGVTSFGQIAAWSEADIDRVDAELGRFQGRIRRDNWIEQAKLLAADDTAGYEDRFGKL